jgi:hypothetical protein
MTVSGIDTYLTCTSAIITCLAGKGYQFVGRYYFNLTQTIKEKVTVAEAQQLNAAGLDVVALYENQSNSAAYFTAAKGTSDGAGALAQAVALGQPEGSGIYFAVDYDASQSDVQSNITAYLTSVNAAIGGKYRVGVYGSGLTCGSMLDAGLAELAWLSCSSGFNGTQGFTRWNVKQSNEQNICGIDVDPDVAQGDFGQFRL